MNFIESIIGKILLFKRYVFFILFIYPFIQFRGNISLRNYFLLKLTKNNENEIIKIYEDMKKNHLHLYRLKNSELEKIYTKIIEKEYWNLLTKIMEDEHFKIHDYHDFFIMIKKNPIVYKKLLLNNKFQNYIKRFQNRINVIENYIQIKFYTNNIQNNQNEECSYCMESFKEHSKIVECNICHLKLDDNCFLQWLYQGKTTCGLCRQSYLKGNNNKIKIMNIVKYIHFRFIQNEMDLLKNE